MLQTCSSSSQSPVDIPLVETFSLSGRLTSPHYPGSYGSGTVGCVQHNVTTPPGFRVEFSILDLDLQCCRNYPGMTTVLSSSLLIVLLLGWRDDLIQFTDSELTHDDFI